MGYKFLGLRDNNKGCNCS